MNLNPFGRREPSQEQLVEQDRQFSREQGVMMGPQSADDERIYLEQQQERADLIKWQQNLEPELQQFYHDIKGEIQDEDGKWIPLTEQLANERFLMKSTALARPLMSKNLIMSNYTEARILMNLIRVCGTIRKDVLYNRVTYEIKKTDVDYVIGLFKEVVEAAYFRSLNNGERRHLGTIGKRMEIHTDRPLPTKRGLFGLGS